MDQHEAIERMAAPGFLIGEWDDDCRQTFRQVSHDAVVLEMTCPEHGLTLRVDMTRRAERWLPVTRAWRP